jgi:hypothetical protein
MSFEIRRTLPMMDPEAHEEEWTRAVDIPRVREIHGVNAEKWRARPDWWRVTAWVMGLVREEPLEGELRRRIAAALRAVPGVTKVTEADRECWDVWGSPSGEALLSAVGEVVDSLADRTRAHVDRPGD